MKLDVVHTWKELTNADLLTVYGGAAGDYQPVKADSKALGNLVGVGASLNVLDHALSPFHLLSSNAYSSSDVHNEQRSAQHDFQHQLDDQHQRLSDDQTQHGVQRQSPTGSAFPNAATNPANTTASPADITPSVEGQSGSAESPFNEFDS